jgi:NCAIR mutase (PurE)-related protein
MNETHLKSMLKKVANDELSIDEACHNLENLFTEDIGYAHIDHHRSLRKGFPEVIFGEGKTTDQIIGIMERMVLRKNTVLATRVDSGKAVKILKRFPEADYDKDARMISHAPNEQPLQGRGTILVVSAGTSDIPVAKEALLTAQFMGNRVESIFDVGVAGIHRLLDHNSQLQQASVLIVVAGMEGALPSVVAGLTSRPVLAVPTSIGYGASMGGLAALLGMLNSCSSNVAVVNIDNGFGAGYMAATINRNE